MARKKREEAPAVEMAAADKIMGFLEQRLGARRREEEQARKRFLRDFETTPLYAFRWSAEAIPSTLVRLQEWETVAKACLTPAVSLRATLAEVLSCTEQNIDRFVRNRSWDRNSSSPWANVTDIGVANGQSEAWTEIRDFARWGIKLIDDEARTAEGGDRGQAKEGHGSEDGSSGEAEDRTGP